VRLKVEEEKKEKLVEREKQRSVARLVEKRESIKQRENAVTAVNGLKVLKEVGPMVSHIII
tara:strand:+ start:654 stop:836 length:183 start_codon:yes stop_codon:yes gene_type:complete